MPCCARAAPVLLVHTSLMLAIAGGAGLATAARLKWDPSTYVVARELFPLEYRVSAGVLCAASAVLLALGHLAALALALTSPRSRRALLLAYAACMCVLVVCEAGWAAWLSARVLGWLRSQQAHQVQEVLAARDHLLPLLRFLARWHPLPARINHLIQEAEADAPRNLYVGAAAVAVVAALQPAAALLALVCAAATHRAPASLAALSTDSLSFVSTENEKAPLKTAFRNGKLVVL